MKPDTFALTGESMPAERKSGEAVFSGSIIRRGEIGVLVYAAGEKTYFGKTAQLMQEAHTVSHFQKAVLKIGNEFPARGFRSLAVARDEGDGQWQFGGVLPLFDPPREDAKETVATAGKMGVKIKMVTGDALAIAKETAEKLDMGANILEAASLGDSKKAETQTEDKADPKPDANKVP